MATLASCGGGHPPFPAAAPSTPTPSTTLAASASQLALAVSGQARTVTLTNTGGEAAQNLVTGLSGLPAGTSLSASTCGATLAPGASCTLTFTPGATPTAAPGDLAPAGALLEVAADNSNNLSVNLAVIGYGSVHQGGYVFAIDDGTPDTGSIGGKVAALNDLPAPLGWSSQELSVSSNLHENSTSPCHGATDGACNTAQIVAAAAAAGIDAPAATSCDTSTEGGFSDWYLPAACEQGYDAAVGFTTHICGVQGAPLMDNMQSRLVDGGDIAGLHGKSYWGATSWSVSPHRWKLEHHFIAMAYKETNANYLQRYVRCVRAFTP